MKDCNKNERIVVGIDIAKKVFQLHGIKDDTGELIQLKLNRTEFEEFFRGRVPSQIAMEACGGAQHWARLFTSMGHEVQLLHAKSVKMFLQGSKSDKADAQAIFRAMGDPTLHRVGMKSQTIQDLDTVLSLYHGLTRRITSCVNRVRGLLTEYGTVMSKSRDIFLCDIDKSLESLKQTLCEEAYTELAEEVDDIKKQIDRQDRLRKRIKAMVAQTPYGKRFQTIPGVGPITAAELSTKLVSPTVFKNGRAFAAFVGLVPGHTGSGGKTINLGITKRGDRRIRALLVECAYGRVRSKTKEQWVINIHDRKPAKVAAVAIAAHIARTAWALAAHNTDFKAMARDNKLITAKNTTTASQAAAS